MIFTPTGAKDLRKKWGAEYVKKLHVFNDVQSEPVHALKTLVDEIENGARAMVQGYAETPSKRQKK